MKTCSACGLGEPEVTFGKLSRSKDGLNTRCKSCCNKRGRENYAADLDGRRARRNRLNSEKRDEVNEKARARYHERYKEEMSERRGRARAENPEKFRAYSREYARKWRAENPEEYRAAQRAANFSRKGSKATKKVVQTVLSRDEGVCYLCGDLGATTLDHLLPIAEKGCSSEFNLSAAHQPCNLAKAAKTPLELDLATALKVVGRMGVLGHPEAAGWALALREQRKVVAVDLDAILYPYVDALVRTAEDEGLEVPTSCFDTYEGVADFLRQEGRADLLHVTGHNPKYASPISGCKGPLEELLSRGYTVRYYTERPTDCDELSFGWLQDHALPQADIVFCSDKRETLWRDRFELVGVIDDKPKTLGWCSEVLRVPNLFGLRYPYNSHLADLPFVRLHDDWFTMERDLLDRLT